jgi:hypothetical protein
MFPCLPRRVLCKKIQLKYTKLSAGWPWSVDKKDLKSD